MTDNRDNTTSSSAIAVDERDATVAERGFFTRLYTGSGGIDVIGKRRTWYWPALSKRQASVSELQAEPKDLSLSSGKQNGIY